MNKQIKCSRPLLNPMTILSSIWKPIQVVLLTSALFLVLIFPATDAWAKRPPETRNQDEIEISQDMHGRDLNGYEFIKIDLRGVDLSDSELKGAVFNNSMLQGSDLRGADMTDLLAYSTDFDDADLRDANLTNALLMESSFNEALIEGADFSEAIINRIQLKRLCAKADGVNSTTGISTSYSLGC